jgi:hypothetical protein
MILTATTATPEQGSLRHLRVLLCAAVIAVAGAVCLPHAAQGAYGDHFGIAPINSPGAQDVPALPGQTDAFWAAACDRLGAPALGDPIPGGVGSRPATVLAPDGDGGFRRSPVAAPAIAPHCLDFGAPRNYPKPVTELWTEHPYQHPSLGELTSTCGSFAPCWRLAPQTQAGAHPDGSLTMTLNRAPAGEVNPGAPDGDIDNIYVDLPPGFVGDPNATTTCGQAEFGATPMQCPPSSQVGVLQLFLAGILAGTVSGNTDERIYPVYNLQPRRGYAAELGFGYASELRQTPVRISAKARTNSDFGVSTFIGQIPAALPLLGQEITIWGTPWASYNDAFRYPAENPAGNPCSLQPGTQSTHYIPPGGLSPACQRKYDPSWGPIKPFVTNPTRCDGGEDLTSLAIDQYLHPGPFTPEGDPITSHPNWKTYSAASPPLTGCEKVGFEPGIALEPSKQGGASQSAADSPAGLDVSLEIPQNELPFPAPAPGSPQGEVDQYLADAAAYWRSDDGVATSHLKDTVVTLPEGMTLNPAAASGQGACSMAQIGVTDTDSPVSPKIRFDNGSVGCPESSKVAEVTVETPLLGEADWPEGDVYLAAQGDNPFNSDFAIYIAVESPERGVLVKLAGKVEPDPVSGRLKTTFAENPQLPFDRFTLKFKAGSRAPLATPVTCGTHTTSTALAPYSDPGDPAVVKDPFEINSSPAGGCPASKAARPFALGFQAGSTQILGGAHSPFTVRITRGDGNQELSGVQITTPRGFAARLAGVPYCSDAAIAQAASRTASGDGALERSSPSCPAASKIGTTTIGAGAGSQPFYVSGDVHLAGPYKGAPLSLAFVVPAVAGPFDLGVQVVRAAVNVDPKTAQITTVSDPIPQILRGVPLRLRDIRVDIDRPGFALNPTDCSEQLITGAAFGSHGAATALSNRFQVAECARLAFKPRTSIRLFGGIKRGSYQGVRAVVRPRPGDANISRAVVRFPRSAFVAQEHLKDICTRVQYAADACPKRSVYGRALAYSPLLDFPLTGNVYLRSSDNTLPDLVADLRGPAHQPIRIEVAVRNDSVKGALRNTVQAAPDAPVSYFRLQTFGKAKGLIVNSKNICKGSNRAWVGMKAHNGRRVTQRINVFNKRCKAYKRKAKKKAKAKRRGHTRRGGRGSR